MNKTKVSREDATSLRPAAAKLIGSGVKAWRKDTGLTVKGAVELAGYTQAGMDERWSAVERGETIPGRLRLGRMVGTAEALEIIEDVSAALGIPVGALDAIMVAR